jgi:hypothetical protein
MTASFARPIRTFGTPARLAGPLSPSRRPPGAGAATVELSASSAGVASVLP